VMWCLDIPTPPPFPPSEPAPFGMRDRMMQYYMVLAGIRRR
jgi:hypothetical protein